MRNNSYKVLTGTAILAAMSLVLEVFVHFPVLPQAPYLLYSPGDLPIIAAAMLYGPLSGLAAAFVNATLFVVLTGQGGPWGALMHFVASGGMAMAIGLVSSRKNTSLYIVPVGVATRVALMIPLNLVVTPIYTGLPPHVVRSMIVPVVIPFNVIHAGINTVVAWALFRTLPHAALAKAAR